MLPGEVEMAGFELEVFISYNVWKNLPTYIKSLSKVKVNKLLYSI